MRYGIIMLWLIPAALAAAEPTLEPMVQTGHTGGIVSMSLSADGQRLATVGSYDKTATLWDVGTGQKLRTFTGAVASVCLSADGRRIVTGSQDEKTATMWDAVTGREIQVFTGHTSAVACVSLSADGRWLVSSDINDAILWDTTTGQKLRTFTGHTNSVHSLSLSADGRRLATGSEDTTAIVWDVATGQRVHTLTGHTSTIHGVSLSADGRRVATGAWDDQAILWDAATGQRLRTFVGHTMSVNSVSLSADGRRLASGSRDGTAILWDAATGQRLRAYAGHADGVTSVCLSASGQQLFTGDHPDVKQWHAATGRKVRSFAGHADHVISTGLSADGRLLATGAANNVATVWDFTSGQKLHTFVGHDKSVFSVSLSADGRRLATGSSDGTAVLWDVVGGRQARAFAVDGGIVLSVSLSADGRRVATGSFNRKVGLWDADTGQALRTFKGHKKPVENVTLLSDGQRLVSEDDGEANLWDVTAGQKIRPFKFDFLGTAAGSSEIGSRAALSGDGQQRATRLDKTAVLWDVATGRKLRTFAGHDSWVRSIRLSHDGRWMTTADEQATILWSTVTGQKIHTFIPPIEPKCISPDGTRLVTHLGDGATRIWDATGKELCSLLSIDAGKDWLVVTPDGYFDGSENGAKFLSYRVAGTNDMVPLERYRKQFERPGLLAKLWKGEEYRTPAPGGVVVKQDLPPTVRVTAPAANHASTDGKLTVTAEAESRGEYPVTRFRLKLDGKPYSKKEGIVEVESPRRGKATATWEIDLEPGRHTLEVLAYTQAVFNVSESVEVKYAGGGPPAVTLPTLYVLSVGVSAYPGQDDKLDYAHLDAQALADAYRTHSRPLFRQIESRVLLNERATKDAILEGLEWLRRSATQKDFVVFFYAGHGVKDPRDKFYLFPVDGDRDKLTRTAIDGSIIQDELISIPGQLLVILDACHSGNVGGGKTRGLTENLLKDLSSEEKGVAIMCSATGRELAQESREHRHGLFTQALLEGIAGQGGPQKVRLTDGAVYFKELDNYVTGRVKELSKGYQHPVTSVPRNFRDYPVSRP